MENNEHLNGMNALSEAKFNNDENGCILAILMDTMENGNNMSTILIKGNSQNIIPMVTKAMMEQYEVYLILSEALNLYSHMNSHQNN
jgi:hypothetical protein